jgi:predicted transcriptional regulator of viral defense system
MSRVGCDESRHERVVFREVLLGKRRAIVQQGENVARGAYAQAIARSMAIAYVLAPKLHNRGSTPYTIYCMCPRPRNSLEYMLESYGVRQQQCEE